MIRIMKILTGILLVMLMLPVISVMAIVGFGISGLYYVVFMVFYRVLDIANRKKEHQSVVKI